MMLGYDLTNSIRSIFIWPFIVKYDKIHLTIHGQIWHMDMATS
jgi:hypothetical protein